MEFNFNKIRSLFQSESSNPLPPELDWEHMQDGIFEKMQAIEQDQSNAGSRTNSTNRAVWIGVLLSVLACGLICVPRQWRSGQMTHTSAPDRNLNGELAESTPIGMDQHAPDNKTGDRSASGIEQGANSVFERYASTLDPTKSAVVAPISSPLANNHRAANNQAGPGNPLGSGTPGHIADGPSMLRHPAEPQVEAQFETAIPLYPGDREATRTLPTLVPVAINAESEHFPIIVIQHMDIGRKDAAHASASPDMLILEGGVTIWNFGYNQRQPKRAPYETALPSFQMQGSYLKNLRKNYFVMAGVQYQQLESRFQYNQTINDHVITLKDTIVQVRNNLISGEHTVIYGDVEKTVTAERQIRHYNRSQMLRAAIGAGKSWRFNAFQTDIYLGGALNTWVHHQGKLVDDDDRIVEYNGASNTLFKNQWIPEGFVGARVHYFITPAIGLTTGIQVQRSIANWSKQEGVGYYPTSFGWQIGLSYSVH